MTTVTIDIDSREARLLLIRAPQRIDRALRAAMEDSTSLLLREATTYPARRSRKQNPGQFVSERQRKFVMAAIREGRIKIPYTRTDTLKKSWSKRIFRDVNGLVGEVGSSGATAPYNRFVQDSGRQAALHRTNWTNTAQEISRRNTTTVQRYFDRRLREEFSR